MSDAPTSGIVTPEAVVLHFDSAGVGSRMPAAAIDFAIKIIFVLVLFAIEAALASAGGPGWLGVTFAIVGTFVVAYGYPVAFETLWDGRTPGKAVMGLRVVTEEGSPIRFRHAAIRGALGIFEIASTNGAIAFIVCLLSERNQRLGDMIAGTLVLRDRKANKAPQATSFIPPAGSEDYAASLDVSSLSADDYVAIRSFLVRSSSLKAAARQGLADQFGRKYATQLRTSPPQWMPSEVFLVCVAAAYQRRFYQPA